LLRIPCAVSATYVLEKTLLKPVAECFKIKGGGGLLPMRVLGDGPRSRRRAIRGWRGWCALCRRDPQATESLCTRVQHAQFVR